MRKVFEERLEQFKKRIERKTMADSAIVTRGLKKQFGKKAAVEGLDLEVPTGSVFGFLGRNGTGKTTTIKMLMNLLQPTSGQAEVLGRDPWKEDLELKQRVGYVAENPVLYEWMKVGELVWFTGSFYSYWDQKKVEALIDRFGLDPEQKVKHLSRGMKAQLALALALGHDPELLLLDEPATGLDVLVRRDFLESIIQVIQEEGRTVFLSSHLVHEVERVADRVAIIEAGRLVVCKEVDEIKQLVKKVLVRMEDQQADLSSVAGLKSIQGDGSQRLLTLMEFGPDKIEQIRACGGQIMEVIDLSLEESFVEYVSPYLAEEG